MKFDHSPAVNQFIEWHQETRQGYLNEVSSEMTRFEGSTFQAAKPAIAKALGWEYAWYTQRKLALLAWSSRNRMCSRWCRRETEPLDFHLSTMGSYWSVKLSDVVIRFYLKLAGSWGRIDERNVWQNHYKFTLGYSLFFLLEIEPPN